MRAMVLEKIGAPLELRSVPIPIPEPSELLIQVEACGVCRTDLHIFKGEVKAPFLPLILGHQVVGKVVQGSSKWLGKRVGVPWLGKTCGSCPFCLSERENLCDTPIFTGLNHNGGYAEYCTADEAYVLELSSDAAAEKLAPLLCAGLIGYRAYRLAGDGTNLGLYGFGSSAHLLIQVAKRQKRKVFVFTRPGDAETQEFARSLGADFAGGSDELPPEPLDAALLFAPVGALYVAALKAVKKGGRVISAGIHMSDIPAFPYSLLWEERSMSSVANLTRQDGKEFIDLVLKYPLDVRVETYPLERANKALQAIDNGSLVGSAVLTL